MIVPRKKKTEFAVACGENRFADIEKSIIFFAETAGQKNIVFAINMESGEVYTAPHVKPNEIAREVVKCLGVYVVQAYNNVKRDVDESVGVYIA